MTQRVKKLVSAIDQQDVGLLIGLAFLGVGAAMVYVPAGLIVVGLVLLALAIWRM